MERDRLDMLTQTINNEARVPSKVLNQQELREFFISHLNRIYCAKSQLVDKLPLLEQQSHFLDLQQAIAETVDIVQNQISRMKDIYIILDAFYQPESCVGLAGILDEAFQSIGVPGQSAALRDLSILFYMQNIESIEMASFKMMILVADKLEEPSVAQLLLECFDEAKEDKILLKQITANYI
jgi:ferritin-like metal-binding protein YciE